MNTPNWIKEIFETIYTKEYTFLTSQTGGSLLFLIVIIIIKIFHVLGWSIDIPIYIAGIYFLLTVIGAYCLFRFKDTITETIFTDDDISLLTSHENENFEEYEDLRTHYTLHNIKNAVKNMEWSLKDIDATDFTNDDLEGLQGNIKRIYETLNDFNKLNTIRDQKNFEIRELVDLFDKLIRPTAKAKGIKFNFVYEHEITYPLIIHQTFYDVFQIFNNLIVNAQKAMENTKLKELRIFANQYKPEEICFKVCDTGIGITPEDQKKIFNLHFSTTGGTGIGLAYVQKELNKMGGQINYVESNNQFSTIFEVKIPINNESFHFSN